MNTFSLGQRVKITGTAKKSREWAAHYKFATQTYVERGLPVRNDYPTPKTFSEGVIVGYRTVTDGRISNAFDSEQGWTQTPSTAQRVWLVAFDLRMKPAMCFEHQLTPIEGDDNARNR